MRVMRFCGGLGNTMLQCATYLQLKKIYPNEEVLVDTTWHKWANYPFELGKVFNMSLDELISKLNDFQRYSFEKKQKEIPTAKDFGYDNFDEAVNKNKNFRRVFMTLSFKEFAECFIMVGVNFKILSDPKLISKINDLKETCDNPVEAKNSSFKRLVLSNDFICMPLRVVANKNIRRKFIKDILNFKRPDFNGYPSASRLVSNGDTYYNIYGNPNDCEGIREELLAAFTFKPITDKENIETLNLIQSTNSVSIHARVVDYEYGMKAAVKRRYFIKAVKYIKRKVVKPVFFIFSDDINWCKENLNILGLTDMDQIIFVNHNKGENSYRDMQLMSHCKHNIIPNSTFSWWGAYLNQNPDKIVCTPYATLPGTISF